MNNTSNAEIIINDVVHAIIKWLKSDHVWIEDETGNRLEDAIIRSDASGALTAMVFEEQRTRVENNSDENTYINSAITWTLVLPTHSGNWWVRKINDSASIEQKHIICTTTGDVLLKVNNDPVYYTSLIQWLHEQYDQYEFSVDSIS